MSRPDSDRSVYLGMRPGDLDNKWFGKYWNPELAPLPEHVRAGLALGPQAAELLPRLSDVAKLLEPGYAPLENGFGVQVDGSIYIAILTEMPGVSPAMWDWWFHWHGSESVRYKLWHPRAHLYAEWDRPEAPGAQSDRSKYVGRTSFVDEYIGSSISKFAIKFLDPVDLGFSAAGLADPQLATAICARGGLSNAPVNAGYLIHHVRAVPGGAEMRSRFWLGGPYVEARVGGPGADAAAQVAGRFAGFNAQRAYELMVHCSQEMAHLADFLPALYVESQERFGP